MHTVENALEIFIATQHPFDFGPNMNMNCEQFGSLGAPAVCVSLCVCAAKCMLDAEKFMFDENSFSSH